MSSEAVLNEFIRLSGVVSALIVDPDGKILSSVTGDFPADTLGEVALLSARGLKSAELMGKELSKGTITHSVIEYVDNVIAMEFVTPDRILVIVASKGANLGRIRFEARKRKKDLAGVV